MEMIFVSVPTGSDVETWESRIGTVMKYLDIPNWPYVIEIIAGRNIIVIAVPCKAFIKPLLLDEGFEEEDFIS